MTPDQVPVDIVIHISTYLPFFDKIELSKTNNYFRNILKNHYKLHQYGKFPTDSTPFLPFTKKYKNLQLDKPFLTLVGLCALVGCFDDADTTLSIIPIILQRLQNSSTLLTQIRPQLEHIILLTDSTLLLQSIISTMSKKINYILTRHVNGRGIMIGDFTLSSNVNYQPYEGEFWCMKIFCKYTKVPERTQFSNDLTSLLLRKKQIGRSQIPITLQYPKQVYEIFGYCKNFKEHHYHCWRDLFKKNERSYYLFNSLYFQTNVKSN